MKFFVLLFLCVILVFSNENNLKIVLNSKRTTTFLWMLKNADSIKCVDLLPYINQELKSKNDTIIYFHEYKYVCKDDESPMLTRDKIKFLNMLLEKENECIKESENIKIELPNNYSSCEVSDYLTNNWFVEHIYSNVQDALDNCGSTSYHRASCIHNMTISMDLFDIPLVNNVSLINVDQEFIFTRRNENFNNSIQLRLYPGNYTDRVTFETNKIFNIEIISESNAFLSLGTSGYIKMNRIGSGLTLKGLTLSGDFLLSHSGHTNTINMINNRICSDIQFEFHSANDQFNLINNFFENIIMNQTLVHVFGDIEHVNITGNTFRNISGYSHPIIRIDNGRNILIEENNFFQLNNISNVIIINSDVRNLKMKKNQFEFINMTTCNPMFISVQPSVIQIIQGRNFTLKTIDINYNNLTYLEEVEKVFMIPFIQYFPFFFQNETFYNININSDGLDEKDIINQFQVIENTATYINISKNNIFTNRKLIYDKNFRVCDNVMISKLKSLLISNRITEKNDLSTSFIWIHLMSVFNVEKINAKSNLYIMTRTNTTELTENSHFINFYQSDSFIHIHGYEATNTINVTRNEINGVGNFINPIINQKQKININRGVFLTYNNITESKLISIFGFDISLINKGSAENILVPYQTIPLLLLKTNNLFNFKYAIQLEPIKADVYDGGDECNYICSDINQCDKCILTDSTFNSHINRFSYNLNGLCFDSIYYNHSIFFRCRHENLKITPPYVSKETIAIGTRNLYNNILRISSETIGGNITLRVSDDLNIESNYFDIILGGLGLNINSPITILPTNIFFNNTKLEELYFESINAILDIPTLTLTNNKVLFSTFIHEGKVKSRMKVFSFKNCIISGVTNPFSESFTFYIDKYLFNFNNSDVVSPLHVNLLKGIDHFILNNNTIKNTGSLFYYNANNDNHDDLFRNFTATYNKMDFITNGISNIKINENFIIDNNVCDRCLFNTLTGGIFGLEGNIETSCLSYCSLQNNDIRTFPSIFDNTNQYSTYIVEDFKYPIVIKDNKCTERLYYGLTYNNINASFPCTFDGMKQMKALNNDILGTISDISCGDDTFFCKGVDCLSNSLIIPPFCIVNKTIETTHPDYFIIQFPTPKEAIDNCKAKKPRQIIFLYNVYYESDIIFEYTNPQVDNDTLLINGTLGPLGEKPIIVGAGHILKNTLDMDLQIINIFFLNGNGIFNTFSTRDVTLIDMFSNSFFDNVVLDCNVFFGIVLYNFTAISQISEVEDLHTLIKDKYTDLKGIVNPPLTTVNTDILIIINTKKNLLLKNNLFCGSYVAGWIQNNVADTLVVNILETDGKNTQIISNVGENLWGSFMNIRNQHNVTYGFNKCEYFCGGYSDQTSHLSVVHISFLTVAPFPIFNRNDKLYLFSLFNNTLSASIKDVPINNPGFSPIRILFGNPFAASVSLLAGIHVESAITLELIDFSEFKMRHNFFSGYPVTFRPTGINDDMMKELNEPIGNIPLFNDDPGKRNMREAQRHNGFNINNIFNGIVFDIRNTLPTQDNLASNDVFCNGLCPPTSTFVFFCKVSSIYSLVSNPADFGITLFNNITDSIYRCIYNRIVLEDLIYNENIKIKSLNYGSGFVRTLPDFANLLIESKFNQISTISGFNHQLDQINDFSSTNFIKNIEFRNVIWKMQVSNTIILPFESQSCNLIDIEQNYKFSSIFYIHTSDTPNIIILDKFHIEKSSVIFDVGDVNDYTMNVTSKIFKCSNQLLKTFIIGFNCDKCSVRSLLFNNIEFSSRDSLIAPYKTSCYDFVGISIRLPSDTYVQNVLFLFKPTITTINVINTRSMSTRKFIRLLNVQTAFLQNIIVSSCNPNPFKLQTTPLTGGLFSCISIYSPKIPNLNEFFLNPGLTEIFIDNVVLSSIYNSGFSQTGVNNYNFIDVNGTVPYAYFGVEWHIDVVIVPNFVNNLFHMHAAISNITKNTINGDSTSHVNIGIVVSGPKFNLLASCTDYTSQVAPIANASSFGLRNQYGPNDVLNILDLNNPNAFGINMTVAILDDAGFVLTQFVIPDNPANNPLLCLFKTSKGIPISITFVERLFIGLFILLILIFLGWLLCGTGCGFLMGGGMFRRAFSEFRNLKKEQVEELTHMEQTRKELKYINDGYENEGLINAKLINSNTKLIDIDDHFE